MGEVAMHEKVGYELVRPKVGGPNIVKPKYLVKVYAKRIVKGNGCQKKQAVNY
jgi:hypothetical protein